MSVQEIKCVSRNVNINGIEITQIPETTNEMTDELQANQAENGQNDDLWNKVFNVERNLVNICVNVNVNEQVKVGEGGRECSTTRKL